VHYHCLFLTKADSAGGAAGSVEDFLDAYKGHEWDWWVFGGRWSWVKGKSAYDHGWEGEVIDVRHPCFFERIDAGMEGSLKNFNCYIESLINSKAFPMDMRLGDFLNMLYMRMEESHGKEVTSNSALSDSDWRLAFFCLRKVLDFADCFWTNGRCFFNIENYSCCVNHDEINESPDKWFLVNVDIHN